MIDERDLFERSAAQFDPPGDGFDRFTVRRERHERRQRAVAGVVTFVIALALAAAVWALRNPEIVRPAPPPNTFSKAHGWIAVGGPTSVTAVDPSGASPSTTLSGSGGDAYSWSNDGSHLLVARSLGTETDLFVIDGFGNETLIAKDSESGGFSPDGRRVVYGGLTDATVYEVSVDGGPSRVLVQGSAANGFAFPIQSPDGNEIVYARQTDGATAGLWMMSANGENQHEMASLSELDSMMGGPPVSVVYAMAWSPSSDRLVFGVAGNGGVALALFTIRADGSGLRLITPADSGVWWSASWSPDGSEIAALSKQQGLLVMTADGSGARVVESNPAGSFIAWNPLLPTGEASS